MPDAPPPDATALYREAAAAPAALERQLRAHQSLSPALADAVRVFDPAMVITCARGSSDHAATYAKYVVETLLGLPAASHAPSVTTVFGAPVAMRRALFLAISQSGGSPDLALSAQAARRAGALTVAAVNETASPLADSCEWVLPLCAGPETSVAASKSYILSLAAVAHLAARLAGRSDVLAGLETLPARLDQAWALDWCAALPALQTARNLFVVSRGYGLGIAQECALKFKETSGIHAEAFSAAEVKHGPMALIASGFPVLMLVPQDRSRDAFAPLAADFTARGATLLMAGAAAPAGITLPVVEGLADCLAPIAMAQSFYGMINALALARGFDPDHPPYLQKVTATT